MTGLAGEEAEVRAAGGVPWRRTPAGELEVLVIHRPRYDDWSFPKGKAEAGERWRDCAVREMEEETGFEVDLGPKIGAIRYLDAERRTKEVRYWAMTVCGGEFRTNDEVDVSQWAPLATAREMLTYPRDVAVLDAFEKQVESWSA